MTESSFARVLDTKTGTLIAGVIIGGVFIGPTVRGVIQAIAAAASKDSLEDRSTTSSAGGGASAYETRKAVDEYLLFHFGDDHLLPYANGPKTALNFTGRLAQLCKKHSKVGPGTRALDVGCAVGGATFELARYYDTAVGIDFSHAFVAAAQDLQLQGSRQYLATVEGEVTQSHTAVVPKDIQRQRAVFQQGDACNLPESLGQFDAVLAANLLCRLPDPMQFIDRLQTLVKPGGVAVLVSPYSWLPGWTAKDKWLGGRNDKEGNPVRSATVLSQLMKDRGFELVYQEDTPFLIREHVRKYQWGCSHACVWKRTAK